MSQENVAIVRRLVIARIRVFLSRQEALEALELSD